MNAIEEFAREFLDEKELELAEYLARLLRNPRYICAGDLVSEILPIYSEKRGESSYTLNPDPIYRPLYYLHMYSILPIGVGISEKPPCLVRQNVVRDQ